jgi:hypothetical protein
MTRGNVFREGWKIADVMSAYAFDMHAMALWTPGCMLTYASREPETQLAQTLQRRVSSGLKRLKLRPEQSSKGSAGENTARPGFPKERR